MDVHVICCNDSVEFAERGHATQGSKGLQALRDV